MKIYLCSEYHVTAATLDGQTCTHLSEVRGRRNTQLVGHVPCNRAAIQVEDLDGSLEAAFRVGGPTAVKLMVEERTREISQDSTGALGPPGR